MNFKKILLIPWLFCLPMVSGIQVINNESNFKNNDTEIYEEANDEPYLNLDVTYGNDAFHEYQPTISSIEVNYNDLSEFDQIHFTGGIIINPLNPKSRIQEKDDEGNYIHGTPIFEVGKSLDITTNKKTNMTWEKYCSNLNEYKYDSTGKNVIEINKSKEEISKERKIEITYPKMFEVSEKNENYYKLNAIAPGIDLWYAPTIENITITGIEKEDGNRTATPEVNLGEIIFNDINADSGVAIFWWAVIGLIILGTFSFIGWKIYKKKNKYLI